MPKRPPYLLLTLDPTGAKFWIFNLFFLSKSYTNQNQVQEWPRKICTNSISVINGKLICRSYLQKLQHSLMD